MITKLTGILDQKDSASIVIDVHGVGYFVHASQKTISQLPNIGEKIVLWVEHIIRQDDQMLCGFSHTLEREWFRALMTVQGVGAKVALSVLSKLTFDELAECIYRQHSKPLTLADGVGPKVASRITLELKGKIPNDFSYVEMQTSQSSLQSADSSDALLALCQLGYNRNDALIAIQSVTKDQKDLQIGEIIRLSLQKLSIRK